MIALVTLLHLMVCVFLILVVLLQTGKGGDLAGAFGGGSQTAFGARGTTTLLSKLTTGSAIVFMVTSLALAHLASRGGSSVVTDEPAPRSSPFAPGQAGPATTTPELPPAPPAEQNPASDAHPDALGDQEPR